MSIELIIYLEPSSEFKDQVDTFLKETEATLGWTTANKYGCHITMAGFFKVEDSQEIKNKMDSVLKNTRFTVAPQVGKPLLIRDEKTNLPVHLILPITSTEEYREAMAMIAEECKQVVLLRLKKINHISLAYWDEENATSIQQNQWQQLVSKGVFDKIKQSADAYFQDVGDPLSWDIVLYERVSKGDLVGQDHVFKKLGRWPLD
ncbi:hypothetical protein INT47_003488 [Mucor saturninus]|uniref:2'-5' RNA ligase n=1 Tax=Mucor saturninus TaxID=64648 RepID=A0A8H7V936_9FUNG|nr:hypothetical protein INT47_003488 [Mucor saturninus]